MTSVTLMLISCNDGRLNLDRETQYIEAQNIAELNSPVSQVKELGPIISSTARGTYRVSSYGHIIEEGNNYHVFYCSSAKPYMPHQNAEQPSRPYGVDMVRYDRLDKTTLKPQNASSPWIVPTLNNPQETSRHKSPCTSTTVFFNGYYYTYFESFSEVKSHQNLLAIFVARTKILGEEPEILTFSGWKKNRLAKEAWKPVILSLAAKEIENNNAYAIDLVSRNRNPSDDVVENKLWGSGVPTVVYSKEKNQLMIMYTDSTYGYFQDIDPNWRPRRVLSTSNDAINFNFSHLVKGLRGTFHTLKIVREPSSKYNNHFVVFTQDFNSAPGKLTTVAHFSHDLKSFKSDNIYNVLEISNPLYGVYDGKYTSGIAATVSANKLGEMAPFSNTFLLNISFPRMGNWFENNGKVDFWWGYKDIYGYQLKLQTDNKTPPQQLGSPKKPNVIFPVPKITRTVLDESTRAFYICGEGFNNTSSVEVMWSYKGIPEKYPIWYNPNSSNELYNAHHYLREHIDTRLWHLSHCIALKLDSNVFHNLKNGWSAKARVSQSELNLAQPKSEYVNLETNWKIGW